MKDRLVTLRAAAAERLRETGTLLVAHRFWVECGAVALLGLVAAYSLGSAALARAAVMNERAAYLSEVHRGLSRWSRELQPPTPSESLAWRQSQEMLLALGAQATEPLTLARLVAQRAEEVGVENLRIRLADEDSLSSGMAVQAGSWAVESAAGGLSVEFAGGMTEVIGFLGSLPPQAQIRGLHVRRGPDGRLHARALLGGRRVVQRG